MQNKFDIIIPAYNPGRDFEETLESCLNQSYPNFLVTVVDDCSTQDLTKIIQKYPEVNYLRTPHNMGPSGARNFGIRSTTGQYISLLDADDLMAKDKLTWAAEEFDKDTDKKIGMVCGNYTIVIDKTKTLTFFHDTELVIDWGSLMEDNLVGCGSVSMRREAFEKVGGFDESLWIAEDFKMWLMISEHFEIKYIPRIMYYYSIISGSGSLTQRKDLQDIHIDNIERVRNDSLKRMGKI